MPYPILVCFYVQEANWCPPLLLSDMCVIAWWNGYVSSKKNHDCLVSPTKKENKGEMRGATSAVAAAFPVQSISSITINGAHMRHLFSQACAKLITFPIFVRCQHLISRNVCRLFSSNRVISLLNKECRINELSRGSDLGDKHLINN